MYQHSDQNRTEGRSSEPSSRPTDRNAEREDGRVRSHTLLAPFVVSSAYVGAALVAGPELFDTGTSGVAGTVSLVTLGTLLLVAGYATSRLYADARRLSRQDADWRPNPWHYVCGGALALLGLRVAELVVTGRSVSSPTVYLLGNAFVALPVASIVAGPLYWANRRRRLST